MEETNLDNNCKKSKRIRMIAAESTGKNHDVNMNNDRNNKRGRYGCNSPTITQTRMADGKKAKEEKCRKWEAKQAQKQQQNQVENQRRDWIKQHSDFVSFVDEEDLRTIMDQQEHKTKLRTSFDDKDPTNSSESKYPKHESKFESSSSSLTALLTPYFDIQENNTNLTNNNNKNNNLPSIEIEQERQKQRLFIAEGTETVRILIRQSQLTQPSAEDGDGILRRSSIQVKSIFLKPSIFFDKPVHLLKDVENLINNDNTTYDCNNKDNPKKKQERKHPKVSESERNSKPSSPSFHHLAFHILIAKNESILSRVAGYPISRGVLACGVIPNDRDEEWLQKLLLAKNGIIRLLALDGINDVSNLGSMIRCSSAFNIDAIILSKDCCDAWYRRSIRVSMGHVFRIPVVRVKDLAETIQSFSISSPSASGSSCTTNDLSTASNRLNIKSYAAVLDTNQLLSNIKPGRGSWCCILGNEGNGISSRVAEAATQKIKIDIATGVDSLSVPIACGILLHGLKEREKQPYD